ncbi:hypothetical protein KJ781_03135 [Patescibacteria group bacterium]|nr:hypothetical protein [Patescibacteria group bacterium]MBU2613140.1 hypothetical protein [Patescibacteria group bacterium]
MSRKRQTERPTSVEDVASSTPETSVERAPPAEATPQLPDAPKILTAVEHEADVERSLEAIYRDEGGGMPDLTKFEPVRSRWWVYALTAGAAFAAVLIVAAWAGFSFFKPFRGFSGQGLAIAIEGSEHVVIGQETTYFINYRNRTSDPLATAELRVTFPSDFVVTGLEPPPNEERSMNWRIGSLPVDGSGTIKIRGVFTGALGTQSAIQVVGSYRPATFNSDFEALATKALTYDESVLSGTLSVPVKVMPGDEVAVAYIVTNEGDEPIEGLEARFTLPEGFQRVASESDAMDGREVLIPLGKLEAAASTTVMIAGTFSSGISGDAMFIAEAGRPSADGSFLPNQRAEATVTVLTGDLSLKLVVNGTDGDTTIQYGGALRFGIGYENTASEDLKDVKLRLRFEPIASSTAGMAFVDWKTYDDNASGTRSGDVVTWSAKSIPMFLDLPPKEEGIIDVSMRGLQATNGTSTLAFRVVLEAEIGSVGDVPVHRTIHATPITIRYLTDADISVEARYFSEEGAPLGSGSLPPRVGETTTYRIRWVLAKRFHELKGVTVTAVLPKIASWPGNAVAEAGEVTYDGASRTVTWTLNRMPEGVNEAGVDFDVAITPTEADADRFAQLMGETRLDATDVALGQPVFRTLPALTTDLENDEGAQGKGVVRK